MAEATPTRGAMKPTHAAEWTRNRSKDGAEALPVVDSPSISADWPPEDEASKGRRHRLARPSPEKMPRRMRTPFRPSSRWPGFVRLPAFPRIPYPAGRRWPATGLRAMGALVLALFVWRVDVVRLLPQTALFYKSAGLEVNLRGLDVRDIKITNETVDGKPVLVIEGKIIGETASRSNCRGCAFPSRTPRGAESMPGMRCWNRRCWKPGEQAFFQVRLASPPPEAAILMYASSTSGSAGGRV